jgi:hypothetical protein
MAIEETVRILRLFVEDEHQSLRRRYGTEAVALAHDMKRVLQERLEAESAYVSLWDDFEANPNDNTARLSGALEAMVEADPALGRRLNAFVEEFHQVIAPPEEARPDLTPAEVTQTDVVPDTTTTSGEKYGDDAGVYLRGNLKPGAEALSEEAGTSATAIEPGEGTSIFEEPTALTTLPQYFDGLHDAVEAYPKGDATDKERLHHAISEIEAALTEEGRPTMSTLREQTAIIEELAPEISTDLQVRLDRLLSDQQPGEQQP